MISSHAFEEAAMNAEFDGNKAMAKHFRKQAREARKIEAAQKKLSVAAPDTKPEETR